MQPQTLEKRVERLEMGMLNLQEIPERVTALEVQIVQFGNEMRGEFSAVRVELQGCESRLRHEIHACEERLRAEMREGEERLRAEMSALNQDTRTHMLVLHEEVIDRLKLLGEANGRRHTPRKRSK